MRNDAPQVYLNFVSGDAVTTALATELGHERISGEIEPVLDPDTSNNL